MNVLVTGAAGFIGSHLCETLLRASHRVIGIDNFNDFYSPALKRQNLEEIKKTAEKTKNFFQCYSGDICDTAMLESLFTEHKIESIIHLAAMAGVRPSIQNPVLYERVNGLGTVNLLEACKKAGVKNFIFGSSSSVYGLNKKIPFVESDPVLLPYSPYAATKRAGELTCHVYHLLYRMNIACLRFFTVYGPRQRPDLAIRKFTELMFQGKSIPIYGDGSFARDFTYIDDIIDGVVKSIDWCLKKTDRPKYDIFNLGESATTSVLELIKLLEEATGITAKKEFLPPQPGDVPITYADVAKSKNILGYNPRTPIREGIKKFVEWYRKAGVSPA
ncbi:MAG: GDP-mannose 4,6-dehydratase [Deltaproteobacteria bacterium]|nr:GDP-mannose 4,6-dehydratase [Deltaproteobacteria bacterium]